MHLACGVPSNEQGSTANAAYFLHDNEISPLRKRGTREYSDGLGWPKSPAEGMPGRGLANHRQSVEPTRE